jgi:hypothetical protein
VGGELDYITPGHRGLKRVLLFGAAAATLVLLSSCQPLTVPGRNPVNVAISGFLAEHEQLKSTEVDLDALVPGDWTHVAIICSKPSVEELDGALGFHWSHSKEFANSLIIGALIFATDDNVESLYSVGQDDSYEDIAYFTPCDAPDNGHQPIAAEPLVLERASA